MNIDLPPIKRICVRNEVDRFGFSYSLSKKFGLTNTPRSFAAYLHGWLWIKDPKIEDFGHYFTSRNTPIIVATKFQKEVLSKNGFANVIAGGLPFAYINESNVHRKPESLLVMPPHSMGSCNGDYSTYAAIIDYVKSIEHEFSEVCFCLHADDANDNRITDILRKKEVNFIVGADSTDANSLYRMRMIFDYYDYVTTTVMGSHILYAAYCGCKISLLKNFFYYFPEHSFNHVPWMKTIPGSIERLLDSYNNLQALNKQFPWLFTSHPKEAIQKVDWANKEIGVENLLDKDQMMDLLGWTKKAKAKAIIRISFRRAINLVKKTKSLMKN